LERALDEVFYWSFKYNLSYFRSNELGTPLDQMTLSKTSNSCHSNTIRTNLEWMVLENLILPLILRRLN